MLDVVWLNLVELSKHSYFKQILTKVTGAEKEWKKWKDLSERDICEKKVVRIKIFGTQKQFFVLAKQIYTDTMSYFLDVQTFSKASKKVSCELSVLSVG